MGELTLAYLKISTADYATHIAGTPLGEAILPNLRTDPEGMTYREMQDHYAGETDRMSQPVTPMRSRSLNRWCVRT